MNRQCFSPLVISAHVDTQMSVEDNALKKSTSLSDAIEIIIDYKTKIFYNKMSYIHYIRNLLSKINVNRRRVTSINEKKNTNIW